MTKAVTVIEFTADQLRANIAAILDKYPFLDGLEMECCSSHLADDIREKYGDTASLAWENLEEFRFLLRGD